MAISIHRSAPAAHRPAAAAAMPSLAQIKKAYQGDVEKHGYKLIADPETDKGLKGTRALAIYKATMGEGKSLALVTDGDHLVYRGRAGDVLVMTYPEDSSRGDDLWVFDRTGNKKLA